MYCFSKAADSNIQSIVMRESIIYVNMLIEHTIEIFLQIAQKHLTALTYEKSLYTLLFFLQVIQYMRDPVPESAVM